MEDVYRRINELEREVSTLKANQANGARAMEDLKDLFKEHDQREMKKYDEIQGHILEIKIMLAASAGKGEGLWGVAKHLILPVLVGVVVFFLTVKTNP